MEYQFDVTLKTLLPIIASNAEQDDENFQDHVIDRLIEGSKLEQEYPDSNYEMKRVNDTLYHAVISYIFKVQVEATSIEQAKLIAPDMVREWLRGSKLYTSDATCETKLSDEQPGLDDLLDWIDDDQPFAVQEPGERYHFECAKEVFGERSIQRAMAGKEDELTVIYGREWCHDVREAFLHEEEIYSSCGACRGSLYDEPLKDEKEIDMQRLARYKSTGEYISQEKMNTWLEELAQGKDVPGPEVEKENE